jgi:hypothetical protein
MNDEISNESTSYYEFNRIGRDPLLIDRTGEKIETYHTPANLPATCSELTITIKDSEKTQRTKHLVYDNYYLNPDDPVIKQLIAQALQEFNAEPESVRIRANLEVL